MQIQDNTNSVQSSVPDDLRDYIHSLLLFLAYINGAVQLENTPE